MEFAFTAEQVMIADTVRTFFAEEASSARTRAAMAQQGSAAGFDSALWSAFSSDLGLAGVSLPEEHSGAGLGMVEFALVAEAAGARVAALPLLGHAMVGKAIASGGTNEQKSEFLPAIAAGEVKCAAGSGPDLQFLDGRLSGNVRFVPHGAVADLVLVHSEDQAWLVRTGDEGVAITAHVTMDQTRPLASITLEGTRAKPLGDPVGAVAAALAAGWICLAAEALGGAQTALDTTVAYARERIQFGRPIGSFQAYKHRLADMMVEIEQARSAVFWAACAADEASQDSRLAIHAAKSFCADTYHMCAGNMIQLHGGIGFTWEHDAHLHFKRSRSILTLLGDGQWHREQVARLALGEAA